VHEGERRLAIAVGGALALAPWLLLAWFAFVENTTIHWGPIMLRDLVLMSAVLCLLGWGTVRVIGWVIRGFRQS
jgi:hypothetical protein